MNFISSVTINWWRHLTYEDKIPLKTGVNLIIGKNGSGKTSLLKMLFEASQNSAQGLREEALAQKNETELVKIVLNSGSDVDVISNVKKNESGNWSNQKLANNVRFISSQRSVASGTTSKNQLIQNIAGDVSMPNPNEAIDVAEEFNKAINRELYSRVLALSSGNADFLKDIQDDYQSGLIDFEKNLVIDLKRDNAVYFIDHKKREVEIGNLSSGEKEYLYFYAFLRRIQKDENKIILIDEPELHLHSSQIRKLCELISNVAVKNQVIIATHSGEVLQYFISQANLVLLSKGKVTNITETGELKLALEETGLPLDPSVFTAHWICAENDPNKPLKGETAPTTPEALSWIFGKDIKKRYWSFGSQRALAEAHISGLAAVLPENVPIKLTVISDADRLSKNFSSYPPTIPAANGNVRYLPFWELENLFLVPELINAVIPAQSGVSGFDLFWNAVKERKAALKAQIEKTITKNALRNFLPDKYIDTNAGADFARWKTDIAALTLDPSLIETGFNQVIADKKWEWIPGKEALAIILELKPDFWKIIRQLQIDKKLRAILDQSALLKVFIAEIEAL